MSRPASDLLVLGSGVAGLSAAVRARRAGLSVDRAHEGRAGLVGHPVRAGWRGRGPRPRTTTRPSCTCADTLAAGAGLCDTDAVRVLVDEGPARVRELIALGAVFDDGRRSRSSWRWPARAGTPSPRVVHAGGDATGAEIERALVAAAEAFGRRRPRGLVRARPARRGRPLRWASRRWAPDGAGSGAGRATS